MIVPKNSDRKTTGTTTSGPTRRRSADLALEQDRDDERVDDQRLDQRQAQDERGEHLVSRLRVARDSLERRGRRAALAERAAERRERDREAGAQADPTAGRRARGLDA